MIEAFDHEAFVVGGFVRDSILGLHPNDCDIATSARPDIILDIFKDYPCYKTGIKHGTVMVLMDKQPIEITTYRVESQYRDYRHPSEVTFVLELKDDLARRDFTINALAYNQKAGLIDHFNGLDDLKQNLLRCINDPYQRFSEDPLRIMRALRFSSTYRFQIETYTKQALIDLYPLLDHIAQERITDEFLKLLVGVDRDRVIKEYGLIWERIFPEVFTNKESLINDFDNKVFQKADNLYVSLTLFLKTVPILSDQTLTSILKRMRLSKDQIKTIVLINHFSEYKIKGKIDLKSIMSETNQTIIMDILNLQYAQSLITNQEYLKYQKDVQTIIDLNECYRLDQLAISGKDIIDNFEIPEKSIKTYLKMMLDEVINERLDNDFQTQIAYLGSIIKNKE
jgi:tRNA nucleotidyltransferase (CCA-adding enzyme)